MRYYAARDLNGSLFLHCSLFPPKLDEETLEYFSDEYIELPEKMFPDLGFEDGPREVTITDIKLK